MPQTKTRGTRESLSFTDEEYMSLIASVIQPIMQGNPDLARLQGALRSRNIRSSVTLADSLSSQMYEDPTSHFVGNQVANLVRKYPFSDSPFDPEGNALRKFLKGERKNRRTNLRLRVRRLRRSSDKVTPYVRELNSARTYVRKVLGAFSLEKVQEHCDLSGGASIGVHGNATNLYQKWCSNWSVTPLALDYVLPAVWNHFQAREIVLPGLIKCHDRDVFRQVVLDRVTIVDANKIGFVPKTAKIHRTIAVEPLLNNFLQKGVDVYMRARLKHVGIDLTDQSRNQRLAKQGSENWLDQDPWVTIDLANASGSLTLELCRTLLPVEWFEYLDSIRSACYTHQGKVSYYESFVSMGNGFCFPLESLIFASLCSAAGCDDFSVYGDDIIVRRSRALLLIELLRYCGFETNVDKTFLTGPFRESCGSDWYAGEDVRPYVSDGKLDSIPAIFAAHNGTLRNRRTRFFFEEFRETLRQRVPLKYRYMGLSGQVPDCYFVVPQDMFLSSPSSRWSRDMQTWIWKAFIGTPVPDPDAVNPPWEVDQYSALRGANPDELYTLRYTTRRRTTWISAPTDEGTVLPLSIGKGVIRVASKKLWINVDRKLRSSPLRLPLLPES